MSCESCLFGLFEICWKGDSAMSSSTSSTSGSLSLSGLSSGLDWQSIVSQLKQVEETKVTALQTTQTANSDKSTAWNTLSSDLSTLQTAASKLSTASDFQLYTATTSSSSSTVTASDVLTATASDSATDGSYSVVVTQKAQAEKLASSDFSSQTSALGISGTILVGGRTVSISSGSSLQDIQSAINSVNTNVTDSSGTTTSAASNVTASIIKDGTNSYRLVLTDKNTGSAGMSLLNGDSSDTLSALGFNDSNGATAIKNKVTGGAQSDAFTSSSTAVETLLGNAASAQSGTVTINGTSVALDLSDSLTSIAGKMTAAGISASVVSSYDNTTYKTTYRLQVAGLTSYTDSNNVLQSLGMVEGTRSSETGVKSSVANTSDGSTPITSSTLISSIYGYNSVTAGDKVTISGTDHSGNAITGTDFNITSTSTMKDLLDSIQTAYGGSSAVTASLTSDGKVQVVDNATGTSKLSLSLSTSLAGTNTGELSFGTFGTAGTVKSSVIQQGQDAILTVDGLSTTSASNAVTTAIPGVTLNVASSDPNTTITVNVDKDTANIQSLANTFISSYNTVMSYIDTQMTYDSTTKKTGGVLFGDTTLKAIKNNLQSTILQSIGSGTYKSLSDIGITIDDSNKLTLDSTKFSKAIASNFSDVVGLFADTASSSNPEFSYTYSTSDTKTGTYTVNYNAGGTSTINGVNSSTSGTTINDGTKGDNANGLQIAYNGSNSSGSTTITFTRGLASLISSQMNSLTDTVNGSVTQQVNSLAKQNTALDTKIASTQSLIDAKMNTMTKQFQAMETALASLKATSSQLSALGG